MMKVIFDKNPALSFIEISLETLPVEEAGYIFHPC